MGNITLRLPGYWPEIRRVRLYYIPTARLAPVRLTSLPLETFFNLRERPQPALPSLVRKISVFFPTIGKSHSLAAKQVNQKDPGSSAIRHSTPVKIPTFTKRRSPAVHPRAASQTTSPLSAPAPPHRTEIQLDQLLACISSPMKVPARSDLDISDLS
jgi:hypothetical protein